MRILVHICGVTAIMLLICAMIGWLDSQETWRFGMYGWPGKAVSVESTGGWIHVDYSVEVETRMMRQGVHISGIQIGRFARSYTHWYSTNLIVVGGRYRHLVGYESGGDIETTGLGVHYGVLIAALVIATSVYLRRTLRGSEPTPEVSAI